MNTLLDFIFKFNCIINCNCIAHLYLLYSFICMRLSYWIKDICICICAVHDCETLCLDCCVMLATKTKTLVILQRHFFIQSTSAYSTLVALTIMQHFYTYKSTFYLLNYMIFPYCWRYQFTDCIQFKRVPPSGAGGSENRNPPKFTKSNVY